MKKSYVKPQVYFEDFQLSASIAAGCEYTTNHAMNSCTYELKGGIMDGRNVFIDASTNCHDITKPDGSYDSICYHVPAETNNLFTSA